MKNFLTKMRNKPSEQKTIFAFGLATFLTFIIFGIWLFNTVSLNSNKNVAIIKGSEFNEIKNQASTISSMFADLKNLLNMDK
jgi:CHASE3 domain sensor protein